MDQLQQTIKPRARRGERSEYEQDDGISIRCLTAATRHGVDRRTADGCQLVDLRGGGGNVGCPDCPYKRSNARPQGHLGAMTIQ